MLKINIRLVSCASMHQSLASGSPWAGEKSAQHIALTERPFYPSDSFFFVTRCYDSSCDAIFIFMFFIREIAVRIVVTQYPRVLAACDAFHEPRMFVLDETRHQRQQLIRQAEGYLELGMIDHALRALDRLGDSEGLESHALYLKGEALRSAERYHEALIELHRSADIMPDDIHIWISMAWCYKRTNNVELAIHSLKEALAIEPGEALLHYNLACYWSLFGDKGQALESLSTAFEIDPNYRDLVDQESDFDPIRQDPDFLALTSVIV